MYFRQYTYINNNLTYLYRHVYIRTHKNSKTSCEYPCYIQRNIIQWTD